MIHLFTTQYFSFPSTYSDTAHVLVFEPTLSGYRQAIQWIEQNKEKEIYRVVVPINETCIDVGDCLVSGMQYEYTSAPRNCTMVRISVETAQPEWPCRTTHSLFDFKNAKSYLDQWYTLPNPLSGLSQVQTMMAQSADESCISKAMDVFGITKNQAHEQWHRLHQGPVAYNKTEGVFPLPFIVVNGPYPLDLQPVVNNIISYINTGKFKVNWASIPLAKLYCHVLFNKAQCVIQGDYIVAPPYGISMHAFYRENAHACVNTTPMQFTHSYDIEYSANQLVWNPNFAGGDTYATIEEYMKWWCGAMLDHMRQLRGEAEDAHLRENYKNEFIRTIYLGSMVESRSGRLVRSFFDENDREKQERIRKYFNDQQELLNLPIMEINQANANNLRDDSFHLSGADYWISLLKKYL